MKPNRLFIGVFPCGLSYCDRSREEDHDYKRLAFLPYDTLNLEWRDSGCPADLRAEIESHATWMASKVGQQFEVSTGGQTVRLGHKS